MCLVAAHRIQWRAGGRGSGKAGKQDGPEVRV